MKQTGSACIGTSKADLMVKCLCATSAKKKSKKKIDL